MTIFEDPLFQKYIALDVTEDEMRKSFLRWMNTQIPNFDLAHAIKNLVEIKKATYVHDRFSTSIQDDDPINPYAILNVIIKTDFGFNDTICRVPFGNFGPFNTKMMEEFQYFIDFRKFQYDVCREISKKYMYKTVTDGVDKYNITKIEYYKFPIFYSRPNILEERISPKEFRLL